MRPQTVAASAWPKINAALCGYSFAPERAQNAPKPGFDTSGGAPGSIQMLQKHGKMTFPGCHKNSKKLPTKNDICPKDDFSEPQEATMRPQTVPARSCPKKRLPCADIRLLQRGLKTRLNLDLRPLGYPWDQLNAEQYEIMTSRQRK